MVTEAEDITTPGAGMGPQADGNIRVVHARTNNLKGVNLKLPRDSLVVITGVSGSGKSSLAFDTLYAEGQRRYIESLSSYARQFLEQMARPDCDLVLGLPPTIAIQQEMSGAGPRSTVATTTEIYDFLRLLYARAGTPHCPDCGEEIQHQTVEEIVAAVSDLPEGTRLTLLAPVVRGRKGHYRELFEEIRSEGYVKARIDGTVRDLDEVDRLERYKTHDIEVVIDRLAFTESEDRETAEMKGKVRRMRLSDSVETALDVGGGTCIALLGSGEELVFSRLFACPNCRRGFEEPNPNTFSFNSRYGRCDHCGGLGTVDDFDPDLIVPDPQLSIEEGAVGPWSEWGGRTGRRFEQMLKELTEALDVDPKRPWRDIPERKRRALLYGENLDQMAGEQTEDAVIPSLQALRRDASHRSVKRKLSKYMTPVQCPECEGQRLRPEALAVTVGGTNIAELTALTVTECVEFVEGLSFEGARAKVAEPILKEIRQRLGFMLDVGLHYLTCDRRSNTLSRGEFQRIRLATQIGSGLTGVCYVLDEPSIGLHHRDNVRLLESLEELRDAGNTVLVVEHDEETIRRADWVLDLGPGAGADGGHVVYNGPFERLSECQKSLTARYLTGGRRIAVPERVRTRREDHKIVLKGARQHNLQDIDVTFPLGMLICVTGVSGSGKSTLVNEILYRALARKLYASRPKPGEHDEVIGADKIGRVLEIDQSPIGRSPRSCPATYTKVFDYVRKAFARTRQSKVRGYEVGRFSYNTEGGRCPACKGRGEKDIEMNFLPDMRVECEECQGRRYNEQTLQITIRGKNIADVLEMTVEQALNFFSNYPAIERRLRTMRDVGLGYLTLGQPSTTLSGGEAQRIKLTRELGKVSSGDTLYILDEPTTGLHFDDVKMLLETLHGLADMGNTLVVIEHNLEVIKNADFIIDLGPEGGAQGGRVVACGPPEHIAGVEGSYTGRALSPLLTENPEGED
ncbi:MAG: excinuclease ABC subunit UvrA [Planctomycetota bacterium]